MFVCSELPNNPGGSITNSSETIAAGVIRVNELPIPLVWVEHWHEKSTRREEETFELVVFSSYEVTEREPYVGEDASMDRRAGLEADRPSYRGGLGGWKGIEAVAIESGMVAMAPRGR